MRIPEAPPGAGPLAARLYIYIEAMSSPGTPQRLDDSRYLHWDDLRRRKPPDGLSVEAWWHLLRGPRALTARQLPLRSVDGTRFEFSLTDQIQEQGHWLDQHLSGSMGASDVVTSPATRNRYLMQALTEEAITSSQLEGASTTRKVAKEMLRSGREPRNRAERMIANNYRAMQEAVAARDQDLTPELVCELQRIVTEGTLANPGSAGRFQSPHEDRIAIYWEDGLLLHTPPPAGELSARMEALCEFANGGATSSFVHPVVRAILVHLWLAYDHPFEDGNGRTARLLFYWCLLRQGYWLAEFVSISSILRKAPTKYARSFLLTETDDLDATYVIHYQLGVLVRAVDAMHAYLERTLDEVAQVELVIGSTSGLNHRQAALLGHAMRHPGQTYTIATHQRSNRISYQTARTDLLDLVGKDLLVQTRRSRAFVFSAPADLPSRLSQT